MHALIAVVVAGMIGFRQDGTGKELSAGEKNKGIGENGFILAAGNKLYVRTFDYLYSFGDK
jgi:hypothetical protein